MYGRDTFMRFASSVCDTPSSFIRRRMRRRNAEPILSIAVNGIWRVVSFNAETQGRRVRREFYGRCAARNDATGVWGVAPRYKTLLMCYYEIGSQCEASSNRLCVLTPAPLRGQASPGGYASLRLCVKHLYTFYMFYTAKNMLSSFRVFCVFRGSNLCVLCGYRHDAQF